MAVELKDNSIHCKAVLNDTTIAWLYEAAGELEAQTKSNTKGGDSGLKEKWQYKVDEANGTAVIGNPLELAIWYELGTGDYAVNGDGRKGGWWIKVGNGPNEIPLEQASKHGWVDVSYDKNGELAFVFTQGMKPRRPLETAFNSTEPRIKRRLEELLKGMD